MSYWLHTHTRLKWSFFWFPSYALQVPGLFKGMASPMAGIPVVNAVLFGVYGTTRKFFSDQDALSTHFYAGMLAGTFEHIR